MGIPYFLTLFLIFIGWLTYKRHAASKQERERDEQFWLREEEANQTRRQDISSLAYITIDLDALPFGASSTPDIVALEDQVRQLSEQKILNLTGISNTDLKLQYGAANLPELSACDDNFASLCIACQTWGEFLYQEHKIPEARQVLEFAIRCGSDIRNSYLLLAQIYGETNQQYLISNLVAQAHQLNSLSKDTIILKLSDFVHK